SSYRYCVLVSVIRRPPPSILFPYTTLFRSASRRPAVAGPGARPARARRRCSRPGTGSDSAVPHGRFARPPRRGSRGRGKSAAGRSEEHTSELQSREKLVCRLLLEKKNK